MNCHCCKGEYKQTIDDVYHCEACGHTFRDYKEDSVKFHKEQYRNIERRDKEEIDASGAVTALFHLKRKGIVEKRLAYVKKYLDVDYECFDVGSGAGTFAKEIIDHVDSVACLELSPCLVDESRNLVFITHSEDFTTFKAEQKYDIIFAWHVLEHVKNITEFKQKLFDMTERYTIVEVPLLVALDGQGRRRSLTSPNVGNYDGHYHYFSQDSFRKFFEKEFNILELQEGVQSPALFAAMEKK